MGLREEEVPTRHSKKSKTRMYFLRDPHHPLRPVSRLSRGLGDATVPASYLRTFYFLYRVDPLHVNTKRRTTCASRIDPSDPSIACLVERRRSAMRL